MGLIKRFILICLLLNLSGNIVFAGIIEIPKEKRAEYKIAIEKIIADEVPKAKIEIDKTYNSAYKEYQIFLQDKNQMKRNSQYIIDLEGYSKGTESPEYYLYLKLIDKTGEYVNMREKVPNTDFIVDLAECIYPYLKKYKISNTNELVDLSNYGEARAKAIDAFHKEIYDYSLKYEENKANNFYEMHVANKSIDLDNTLSFRGYSALKTNVIYISKINVLQILDNGFLGITYAGQGKTIYVLTNSSYRLSHGDILIPYLPVKYTGRYYTYKNLYGEYLKVPMFTEVLPLEYKKSMAYIKIGEPFYFAEKPEWSSTLQEVYIYNNIYNTATAIWRKGYK